MNGPSNAASSRPTFGGKPGAGGGGVGAVTDGVTIDGLGTLASPISLIAPLYAKLNGLRTPAVQALTDANLTIAMADLKSDYILQAGVLTAARTITISNAGAPPVGWSVNIHVVGPQGFNLLIQDQGAVAIHTVVAGQQKIIATYHTGVTAIMGYWNWYGP